MNHLSSIIIATDFSPRANRAVKRAARLAHEHKAALQLLFVLERGPLEALRHVFAPNPDETQALLLASVNSRMRELASVLHSHYSIRAESRVVVGAAHAQIIAQVANEGADLLVIGAHGEHYLRDMIFGSTASKVVRAATAPVLVVRNEEADTYLNVLVAVDFSIRSLRAMRLARDLAPEAALRALHAVELPFEEGLRAAGVSEEVIQKCRSNVLVEGRREMEEFVARLADAGNVRPVVEYGPVSAVMAGQRDRLAPDLVVAGRHGEAGEVGVLLGSATKHIVYETGCDVLVVP